MLSSNNLYFLIHPSKVLLLTFALLIFIAASAVYYTETHWELKLMFYLLLLIAAYDLIYLKCQINSKSSITKFGYNNEFWFVINRKNIIYKDMIIKNAIVSRWFIVINFQNKDKKISLFLLYDSLNKFAWHTLQVILKNF